MKIRVEMESHTRFYYPDVSVICDSNPETDTFQDNPSVIFEVLSPSTRRTDQTEKKDAYLSISSLTSYVMLEQDTELAIVYERKGETFERTIIEGRDGVISLPGIDVALAMRDIYSD